MTSLTFIVAKIGQEAINYDAASLSLFLSWFWTNPAASKSQMKIKLSHQSVHKEGTTATTTMMLIGLLILSCFRMQIQILRGSFLHGHLMALSRLRC